MRFSIGLNEPPQSWAVIAPDLSVSRHTEVLISPSSSPSILSVDSLETVDQRLGRGPFTHISPSPNGRSLALMTFSGTLWVVSTDFQRSLAEYDTTQKVAEGAEGPARQVEWCGNDAVLVTWERLALLVGPFGDTLRYGIHPRNHPYHVCNLRLHSFFYSGPSHAVSEPDGVRVVSPDLCDFIQKVPASSINVFRPGSTAPAAILFDAWDSFQKRAPKADENIRSIKPELAKAVDECIDAAGREWEPHWQRRLLNVCSLFVFFLPSVLRMIHILLNHIFLGRKIRSVFPGHV